jgi:hypothetical protein
MDSDQYITAMCKVVMPFIATEFPDGDFIYQDDGAPSHRAAATQQWKDFHFGRKALLPRDWAPYSPDRNLIEHCWAIIKQEVDRRQPTTLKTLRKAINAGWDLVTARVLENLFASQRKRDQQIVDADGGHIDY